MITDNQLLKLESFIGYGKPNAQVCFLGLEEGGGGYANLMARANSDVGEFADCKDFHLNVLDIESLHSLDDSKIKLQQVWKYMSYIMLKLQGLTEEEILGNGNTLQRQYQNDALGSTGPQGNTLLAEIYPLPCQTYQTWGTKTESYKNLIPQYTSKKDYQNKVIGKRIELFQNLFNSENFNSDAIICYGKGKWPSFKDFFLNFKIDFKPVHGLKNCEFGTLDNGCKVFLTPFFGNGRISYKDLETISSMISNSHK